jgi:hypothetical protein
MGLRHPEYFGKVIFFYFEPFSLFGDFSLKFKTYSFKRGEIFVSSYKSYPTGYRNRIYTLAKIRLTR